MSNFKKNFNNTKLHEAVKDLLNDKSVETDNFLYKHINAFEQALITTKYKSEDQINAQRISAFKDIHKGEDCFIIGNGPSLNKIDLEKLNDYHTFGMNKIFLIFDRVPLDLSYFVSVNKLVVEQSTKEIENFTIPCFISKWAAQKSLKKKDNIFPIETCAVSKTFETDLTQSVPEGCTVTFFALQIAYYMGFERVFLVGVDHNFVQSGAPGEKQKHIEDDINHFDPRYFKGNNWQLADLEGSELFYRCADFFYKRNGRKIIDATHEGKLQIFPKIDYIEALRLAKKKR
ncbi:MAG: 6-hydroxymethylpterin diphosphokinase MptE-like protein [Chitinophagales bacterium]